MPEANAQEMENCTKLCWECRDVCQDTLFNHILKKGGSHINPENIRILTDCIQICQVAADFMRRNADLHSAVCSACSEICDVCAESCEQMGKEHKAIQKCAEICRRCAESCGEMGQMRKAA